MGYGNNSNDYFEISDIQSLSNIDPEGLIIIGCNAGHLDFDQTNPVATFCEKTNNAPVIANDGTTYLFSDWRAGLFSYYNSKHDKYFESLLIDENNKRENKGFVLYYKDKTTGTITTKELNTKRLNTYGLTRNIMDFNACPLH